MEDSTFRNPERSFRASSEGPSPPPRSAREDGDASATRKRPRLDSGDRTYRSLSAEASSVNTKAQSLQTLKRSLEKEEIIDITMEETPQHMTSPRSKVTLNIKEQSTQHQSDPTQESQMKGEDPEIPDSQEQLVGTQSLTPQPRTPSPLGSPEIEVAEPEDATGYAGPTIWKRPGEKSIEERRQQLIETFPLLQETEDWRHVLSRVAMSLQWDDSDIGPLFNQLSDFLDQWIILADESPQKIWELWSPDTDLWNHFGIINEAITRRNTAATMIRGSPSSLLSNEIDLTGDDSETTVRPYRHDRHDSDPVLRFLKAAVAVLARLLQMDRQTLIETVNDTAEPDLGGKPFIHIFNAYFLENQGAYCREYVWRIYSGGRWKPDELLYGLVMEFLLSHGVDNLVDCALYLIDRSPTDLDYAAKLLETAAGILLWTSRLDGQHENIIASNYLKLATLYTRCAEKLEESIKKQASGFTIDVIQRYMVGLSDCLKYLSVLDYSQTMGLLPEGFDGELQQYLTNETFKIDHAVELVTYKFRLETAFLCIKNGRMESRVAGVEAFAEVLLYVFKRYHQGAQDGDELHPVVAFCKDFIQTRDIISYLVGVDSHPQVVSRSKNIIGFQVVTHCYLQRDTDTIWTAMTSSQDPRRSEAIMEVLVAQVDYAETTFLKSFVEKLINLPMEAYDIKMRQFIKQLLPAVAKTPHAIQLFEMICTGILIPILQECLRHPNLSLKDKKERWYFASSEFRSAANQDLTTAAKEQICDMALKKIKEAGYASTAGIAILGAFIDANYYGSDYNGDSYCATEHFAELIVDDMGRCSQVLQDTGLDGEDVSEILRPRLDLIEKCLQTFSDWPYESQKERLWQTLVGNVAMNDRARDNGYRMLARLLRAASARRIAFLDSCTQVFFQKLCSDDMAFSILEFAKEASAYYERFFRSDSDDDQSSKPLPGDMFWHIALRAESHDLVEKATQFFVDYNLSVALGLSQETVEQNHIHLVDRCVAQLTAAASQVKNRVMEQESLEDVLMCDMLTDPDFKLARVLFSRSLYVLRQFLVKIREKRLGSPAVRNDSPLSSHSLHGEEMIFTFFHPSDARQGKMSLSIGSESTLGELVARLCKVAGYTKIRVFAGGQIMDLESNIDERLQDIPLFKSTKHLMLQKFPGSRLLKEEKYSNRLLPLEQQVLVHFDKLYELLDLNDEMGKEACNFLMTFPPKQEILSNSSAELIPLEYPYKSIYSCYVLKKKLLKSLGEGASCEDDLKMIVIGVGEALVRFTSFFDDYFTSPADTLLLQMTNCLHSALKEAVPEALSQTYFPNASLFIDSIVQLLDSALVNEDSGFRDRTAFVQCCFPIALEASLKDANAWSALKSHGRINDILKASWLSSEKVYIRINTTQAIRGICAALPVLSNVDAANFLEFFWNQILSLVPAAQDYATQSKQFFDLAMIVFRAVSEHDSIETPLQDYVRTWSMLLLSHRPQGSTPTHDQDHIVEGLTDMLSWSLQLIKAKNQNIESTTDLLEGIFVKHVFPLSDGPDYEENAQLRVPILSSSTRAKLYGLLMSLTTDQKTFHTLVRLLKQIVPGQAEKSGAWASGIAQPIEEQSDTSWMIDRDKIVRADTGYAGLKNLSNTCYLNSLFMQLFMNVRFRDFMLHAKIIDPVKGQVLLHETQRLFAYLQDTWLKCVDPSNVVENIITFDGEPIDVHVQMDVDEFYNLLFDRWENQLVSDKDKKTFRSFYGGELVQQIKSQNCDHVSERLEPFSVIQCEIQGKAGLLESLDAFIEGEMMQGDNKYKCSSCDTYVNAVKRACLKRVPDNLIFHLKRFDYDLVHGTRNKINDQFEFPMELDMAFYNVKYLQDLQGTPDPDKFMLVGILVHSGTAEIGHYYSFIRERPGIKNTWVEMNDAEVSSFDPANIPNNCFGGWDHSTHPAWTKSYNAYMLFYQRIDSMTEDAISYPTEVSLPVQTEVPIDMSSHLATENETWVRNYCLLDPSYVKFTRDVLEKYRSLYQEHCSEDHILETELIEGTIHQIELIFARVKECKHLDELLRSLERMLRRCCRCTNLYIRSITADGTFRNLLFRCPQDMVKQKLADEIFHGLNMLKEQEPSMYDTGYSSPSSQSSQDDNTDVFGAFQAVLTACDNVVDTVYLLTKGWDDFWGFMCRLAVRGNWEKSQIQDREYFTKVLQIMCYNGGIQQMNEWTFANNYLKCRLRKRYNMANVARLLIIMFRGHVDAGDASDSESEDGDTTVQFNQFEHKVLQYTVINDPKTRISTNIVLAGFLALPELDTELYRSIMKCYMRYLAHQPALRSYQTAIAKGASVSPASLAVSYLTAASVFVEACPDDRMIQGLITRLAEAVQTIGDEGGPEHLQFFSQLRFSRNPNFPSTFLRQVLTKRLYLFVPHLLCYYDGEVRRGTAALANALIFGVELDPMDEEHKIGKQLTRTCLAKLIGIIEARKLFDIKRLDDLIDAIRSGLEKFCDEEIDEEEDRMLREKFNRCLDAVPHIAAASPDGAESVEYSDSDELTDISTMPA